MKSDQKNYVLVMGLEVHIELKTKSKMFCGCRADHFGEKPNIHTCPVCLGLPGALPVPNKTAIDWCVKIALALGCKINKTSKFDRKNYFYPDLPKGYQISQYDQPFGENGMVKVKSEPTSTDEDKEIRITRVHMEEDTGKLIHKKDSTLIDFNRSGVPLVEIVTEPDFENSFEVVEYLKKIQQIVRYLDVSDTEMDKGQMRLEPNISLREFKTQKINTKNDLPDYKVEVKNINSFKFVEKAIAWEETRQKNLLEKGQKPKQETRGWNEARNETVSQRSKGEAHDYRYFPEPDIPPIKFTDEEIARLKASIGELPQEKFERFKNNYQLSSYDAEIITRKRLLADFFEKAVRDGKRIKPKEIANKIINRKIDPEQITPSELIQSIISSKQTTSISDDVIKKTIRQILEDHKDVVAQYKKGKIQVIGFLIGQAIKKLEGVDASLVKNTLQEMLK